MSSVKAALTVTLKANSVVVAEIEDAALWQQVLTAINRGNSVLEALPTPTTSTQLGQPEIGILNNNSDSSALGQFAAQIGVDVAQVQGACSPTSDGVFMHLDSHCWEEMKKQVPQRGILAIAPLGLSATLLALWFQKAGLGSPTQAQSQAVLGTISLRDNNPSRSIQNTVWLQSRAGGQIVLNPAEISRAIKLAKCFCTKDWAPWKGTTA